MTPERLAQLEQLGTTRGEGLAMIAVHVELCTAVRTLMNEVDRLTRQRDADGRDSIIELARVDAAVMQMWNDGYDWSATTRGLPALVTDLLDAAVDRGLARHAATELAEVDEAAFKIWRMCDWSGSVGKLPPAVRDLVADAADRGVAAHNVPIQEAGYSGMRPVARPWAAAHEQGDRAATRDEPVAEGGV